MWGAPALCAPSFNPRAREGRDNPIWYNERDEPVSIHAPVKGATRIAQGLYVEVGVSIHAPVKGATPITGARTR